MTRRRRRFSRAERRGVQYGACPPEPPAYVYEPCRTRREGDEMVCFTPGCGMRWSADEPKPNCYQARKE